MRKDSFRGNCQTLPKLTEAHFEARRKQILEATFHCLARKGYSRMTIQDIAAEARLSVGTLYLYFKSKEEMVRALSEEMRAQTDASIEESFPEGGALEILGSIFEFLLLRFDNPAQEELLRVDVQIWAEALYHAELKEIFQASLEDRIEKFSVLIIQAQHASWPPGGALSVMRAVAMVEGAGAVVEVTGDMATAMLAQKATVIMTQALRSGDMWCVG